MTSRGTYRSVHASLTADPEFQALSPPAKLVFYTLRIDEACNMAGIFRFYLSTLPEMTGLSARQVDQALAELDAGRWVHHDGCVVWIRNALRFSPGISLANKKHAQGVLNALAALPKTALLAHWLDYYADLLVDLPDDYREPFEGLSKGYQEPIESPSNNIDIDIDIDRNRDIDIGASAPGGNGQTIPYETIIGHLNETCGKSYKATTKHTRTLIRQRWAEGWRLDDFQRLHLNMHQAAQGGTWAGPERDMTPFLRPETLYRASHFESYLNWNLGQRKDERELLREKYDQRPEGEYDQEARP